MRKLIFARPQGFPDIEVEVLRKSGVEYVEVEKSLFLAMAHAHGMDFVGEQGEFDE